NTATIGGDTLAPTVSVAADRNALLAGQTALVTFTFSEQIAGFALGDVAVHGGALGNAFVDSTQHDPAHLVLRSNVTFGTSGAPVLDSRGLVEGVVSRRTTID
ncbi:Ig-like domain-containing protein, partial [Escherichia coli]|uniref:Ig-like domain-containing protein n=1 Tax=Escherichia coli TaxID=562 RepID=UPI0019150384